MPKAKAFIYFEDPQRSAIEAEPFWLPELLPLVLPVTLGPPDSDGSKPPFSVANLPCKASVVRLPGGIEHVRLSDSGRTIQLVCRGASIVNGPVSLNFSDFDLRPSAQRLQTLRRLIVLLETGAFPSDLFNPHPRARRLATVLQAFDAKEAGANDRQIAEAILGTEAVSRVWPGQNNSMKERVRNYLREARAIIGGELSRFMR